MRKRLLLATGAMAGLACVGLLIVAMLPVRSGVTKAKFNQILHGMTLEEVEGVLGERGKDDDWRGAGFMIWIADGGWVSVYFDRNRAHRITWRNSDETVLQKILRWLRPPPVIPPPAPPQSKICP